MRSFNYIIVILIFPFTLFSQNQEKELFKKNKVKMVFERDSLGGIMNFSQLDKNGLKTLNINNSLFSKFLVITEFDDLENIITETYIDGIPSITSVQKIIYNKKNKPTEIYMDNYLYARIIYDKNNKMKEVTKFENSRILSQITYEYFEKNRKQVAINNTKKEKKITFFDNKNRKHSIEVYYNNEIYSRETFEYYENNLINDSYWILDVKTSGNYYFYDDNKRLIKYQKYSVNNNIEILERISTIKYYENGLIEEIINKDLIAEIYFKTRFDYVYFD